MGGRGYSTSKGIAYVPSNPAYVLVRVNPQSLFFYKRDGMDCDLLRAAKKGKVPLTPGEGPVDVPGPGTRVVGRLCIRRKSDQKMAAAQWPREARRECRKRLPETVEFAQYVRVLSPFPQDKFGTEAIVEG